MNLHHVYERFRTKVVEPMRNEYPYSHQYWIEPLKVISFKNNTLTLHHDFDPLWVQDHYGERIKELLNDDVDIEIKVVFTNQEGE